MALVLHRRRGGIFVVVIVAAETVTNDVVVVSIIYRKEHVWVLALTRIVVAYLYSIIFHVKFSLHN